MFSFCRINETGQHAVWWIVALFVGFSRVQSNNNDGTM